MTGAPTAVGNIRYWKAGWPVVVGTSLCPFTAISSPVLGHSSGQCHEESGGDHRYFQPRCGNPLGESKHTCVGHLVISFSALAQVLYGQPWEMPACCDLLRVGDSVAFRPNRLGTLGLALERRHLSHLTGSLSPFRIPGQRLPAPNPLKWYTTTRYPTISTNIQCSSVSMEVTLQRSYIESLGYNASELYLNDPNCRPQTTGSQVLFRIPLNHCGTFREVNSGSIAYYNNIRAYSSGGVITRQTNLQLRVGCKMEQNTTVQIVYMAKEEVTANETSWGRYSISMAFYTSDSFWRPVHEWPYYVDLNQDLFVQVQLNSSDPDLVVFVDTCVASPSSHDFVSKTHDLIRNGCVRDGTYSSYYSNASNTSRFKFSAFKFLRSHPSVYLQCRIVVCQVYDYSARCYRGCLPRSKRDLSLPERKTEVVVGPIQLRRGDTPGGNQRAGTTKKTSN
ncbi:CUZD1 protein, partial [Polyodon spathula]|nr:CUZD1 protein [Polyodon spathula]